MPSESPQQRRFMAIAARNADFAKKAGIPQSVAEEFHRADKEGDLQRQKAQARHLRSKPK